MEKFPYQMYEGVKFLREMKVFETYIFEKHSLVVGCVELLEMLCVSK